MRFRSLPILLASAAALLAAESGADRRKGDDDDDHGRAKVKVQLGPRPFYLVDGLAPGRLKDRLSACKDGPFRPSDFSIGHRGAALEFPEHSKEAYLAGARMGAGIVECDVTFTKD